MDGFSESVTSEQERIAPAGDAEGQADDAEADKKAATKSEAGQSDDDADGQDGESEDGAEDEKPKRPSGARRLKLRNQALMAQNAELQRRLDETSRRGSDGGERDGGGDAEPKESDFANYLEYERARSAWDTRRAVREEFKRGEEIERSKREAEEAREHSVAYAEKLEEARERITDFDEVVGKMRGTEIRIDVAREIAASDKGPLIAYHIATNPEKLDELNAMTPRELAREIGRLEATVRYPAAKTKTNAPKPSEKPKGGAAASPDPSKMSMAEYEKWRSGGGGKAR